MRILGKAVHGKSKDWRRTQSQVRRIGNMLNTVRLMGRLAGSRIYPETQGSEPTGDDIMRDEAENGVYAREERMRFWDNIRIRRIGV